MPIQTFAFPNNNYIFSSWQRLGASAYAQFEIFVVKVGSNCENKTDLDEKQIIHYKLVEKVVRGPQKYFCSQNTIVRH